MQAVVTDMVETLMRQKVLYRHRLLDRYFLVVVDGTGVLTYSTRHYAQCLTHTHQGQTRYYHPVLEVKLVTASGWVFSLLTEFIENLGLRIEGVLPPGRPPQSALSALAPLPAAGWVVCWRAYLCPAHRIRPEVSDRVAGR